MAIFPDVHTHSQPDERPAAISTAADAEAAPALMMPWRLLPLLFLLGSGAIVFALGWNDFLSFTAVRHYREALLGWRDAHPLFSMLDFAAVYIAVVALSLPGAIWMTIIAGFLFGPVGGSVFTVAAATTGATFIFLAARFAFAGVLRRRAGHAISRMRTGFQENALAYLLFLRFVPVFPFWLVNLVPAFLGVRLGTFVLGTLIGIIPGSVVYSLVGSGVGAVIDAGGEPDLGLILTPPILIPLLGLAILSLLPAIYRHHRRRAAGPGGSERHRRDARRGAK